MAVTPIRFADANCPLNSARVSGIRPPCGACTTGVEELSPHIARLSPSQDNSNSTHKFASGFPPSEIAAL
ncbi:hypothetical protein FTUN_4947 [Frigoriglobus tundricola]|uniref:Uncharacterized protein n=1 Tax=Frigoriglobus tundricola TaxID=2774151 RepID=A0A6M5YVZ3_9BACT|nr:hypothetical protein FTUN_4947 [Frigoriglobus tundricola]